MKTMKLFLVVFLAVLFSGNISAQTKTDTFKVWGKCEMCKNRIETAAKSKGVSNASWDVRSKMLTVSYDPAVTNSDAIAKGIAAVGHDTEKFKSDDKSYNSLPGCCKYDKNEKSSSAECSNDSKSDHSAMNHHSM
jgi:copper chaperone CopZ